MKKNIILLQVVWLLYLLSSCQLSNNDQALGGKNEMKEDYTQKIIRHLGCEYEIIEDQKNINIIMEKYANILAEGERDGYTPVIIVPSEIMIEIFEDDIRQDGYDYSPESIVKNSERIDGKELLKTRLAESMPIDGDDYDIAGEFAIGEPVNHFNSIIDYGTQLPHKKILIAKIPTTSPWEVAAWIPMGGFNECPMPEEQVAIFKYWYDEYGAIPAVVSYDIWELYVPNPPKSQEEAQNLAWEQFGFCGDIVWQGVGEVNKLAGTLTNSSVWYFWWD